MIPLRNEEKKLYCKQEAFHICEKIFCTNDGNKKHQRVKDHFHCTRKYRWADHGICNLRYKTAKEIPSSIS